MSTDPVFRQSPWKWLPMVFLMLPCMASGESGPRIETSDIHRFWEMYDNLSRASTRQDSLDMIQRAYLDKATPAFARFIKARNFTAPEYQALIMTFPAFWKSIRPLTQAIDQRRPEILAVFDTLSRVLPGFTAPDVCFAIGCLRTGGTTSNHMILIGAEIAAADPSVDKAGMNDWLQYVLGQSGDIVSMVAHEAVHTRQTGFPFFEIFSLISHRKLNLLNMSITEGSADFITSRFLGLNINEKVHSYGKAHYCPLLNEFRKDIATEPFDYSHWLYNGNASKGRPADLGYYMGSMITAAYYDQAPDKTIALKTVMRLGKYKKVYRRSGMEAVVCQ